MPIFLTTEQYQRLKKPHNKRKITVSRIKTRKDGSVTQFIVPERAILNAILEYLWTNGYYVWRQNSGTVRTEWGTYVKLAPAGTADIIGMTPQGQFIAIETKTATGKQRFSQEVFQRRVEDNKGIYILARSVTELIEKLNLLTGSVK